MAGLEDLSNEDLMAAIRHEKSAAEAALASRGPRSGPKYVEQRHYPHLTALYEERNRRMKERREAQSGTVDRMVDQGTIHSMFQQPQEQEGE